jgi:carbon-monoxide dehydrogenase medium subunit
LSFDKGVSVADLFSVFLRVKKAEAILRGKKPGRDLVEEASQLASEEIQPITDNRSTAWYRKEVSKVLVRKALGLAWRRAGGMDIF